jgi:hypothetical protein
MYLQTNRRSNLTDAALLTEELVKIYSTPTPKVVEAKKATVLVCLIDAWISITLAGVQYL